MIEGVPTLILQCNFSSSSMNDEIENLLKL